MIKSGQIYKPRSRTSFECSWKCVHKPHLYNARYIFVTKVYISSVLTTIQFQVLDDKGIMHLDASGKSYFNKYFEPLKFKLT